MNLLGGRRPGPWQPYTAAIVLVTVASFVGFSVRAFVTPVNLVMPYLVAVVICGRWWGLGSALLASFLGVICFDLFFVHPYLSFAVADAEYLITFAALLVTALVIGTLTARLRDHAAALRTREQETAALYAFSRSMAGVRDLTEAAEAIADHVFVSLDLPVTVLLKIDEHALIQRGTSLSEADMQAGWWVLQQGKPAGWSDTEYPEAAVGAVPLRLAHETIGVVVARHPEPGRQLTSGQRRFMEAFAAQGAVVAERIRMAEEARQAHLLMEAEKIHDALLHSVSHSLRTPLASIIGSLSAIQVSDQPTLDASTRQDLIQTAREEAERLNDLVGDLLDMTRLEAGHLRLLIDWYAMDDVVGAALGQAQHSLEGRPIQTRIDADLPLVPMDQALIVQVLDNLLSNAAKYSPPGSPIELDISLNDRAITVSVADRGFGISPEDRERIFDKFYRVERPGGPPGTGLGLTICKGIVEAHHGRIRANLRPGGGTVMSFTLPIDDTEMDAAEVKQGGEAAVPTRIVGG